MILHWWLALAVSPLWRAIRLFRNGSAVPPMAMKRTAVTIGRTFATSSG
jgi:hypothetical protein